MSIRLLRARQCAEIMGFSLPTWWAWVKSGRAPAGTSISASLTVWRSDDIEALIDSLVPRKMGGAS